jgi:cytidyltransferase-like protein
MVMGRFQPFTNGHVKMIQEVYKQNNLPVCVCVVSNTKFDTKHPFSDELMMKEFDLCLKPMKEFLDVIILKGGDFGRWFDEMKKRGYQPQLWGCGSDRLASYTKFATNPKYHTMFDLPEDFNTYEIKRTDDDVSATKVREALRNEDKTTFEKMMPKGSEKLFNEFRDALTQINENSHISLNEFVKNIEIDIE